MMYKSITCIILILAGIVLSLPATFAEDKSQNQSSNLSLNENENPNDAANITGNAKSTKILRMGFDKIKPLNDLGKRINSAENMELVSGKKPPFNISQRRGSISNATYNRIYKPIYKTNEYINVKPVYEAPSDLGSRSVYVITGYPVIKAPNGIP